MKALNADR